jgi:hypothetical protein
MLGRVDDDDRGYFDCDDDDWFRARATANASVVVAEAHI